MLKQIIVLLCFCLCIFSHPVLAAINWDIFEEALLNQESGVPTSWPVGLYCAGSDVNLRSAPNLDSDVVGVLQEGDLLYCLSIASARFYEGYPWFAVITSQGQKGFVNAKFLGQVENSMTRAERFKAAFDSSVFYDFTSLVAAHDGLCGNGNSRLEEQEKQQYGYAKYKIALGDYTGWSYCETIDNKPVQRAAKIVKAGYKVAGLEVGEAMDAERLAQFSKDMQAMGWYASVSSQTGEYRWCLDGSRGDSVGPLRGFGLTVKDGTLTAIDWNIFLVD